MAVGRSGDRAEVGGEAVVVELIERDGAGEGVGADARAAELGEMAADVQGGAEVAGEGADVGAAAAVDAELQQRPGVVQQLDGVDVDGAGRELHGLAATGEVVGAAAFDFERAERGGCCWIGPMKVGSRAGICSNVAWASRPCCSEEADMGRDAHATRKALPAIRDRPSRWLSRV